MTTRTTTSKKSTKKGRDDAADWDTARETVREHADSLRAMSTHAELFTFSRDHGLDTGSLFAKFKTELRKQLRIDYDGLREKAVAARLAQMALDAQSAPQVLLYAAGDSEVDAFAVCSADGADPWYGDFHTNDAVTEQDSADLAAARKAVYLAGQLREQEGLELIGLRLVVSNHRVNATDLARDMLRHRVHTTVEVVDDGADNPALEVCRLPGFRSWREVSLTDLLDATSGDR